VFRASKKVEASAKGILFWLAIALVVAWSVFPLLMVVLTSFKSRLDAFRMPPVWLFKPTLSNYREVFELSPFGTYFVNTLVIAAASTAIALVLGSLAAYSLARFRFRAGEQLSFWIISIRMTPPVAAAIPVFILMRQLGLLDTRLGLIIMYTTFNLPFAIWLMKGFFADIPQGLEESALIDGCSRLQAFWRIAFPLAAPGLMATAVFCFTFTWNEFFFALILTGTRSQTLPVAITSFIRETGIMWGQMFAAAVLVMAPMVLFTLLVQRYLVRGLTLGAVKE
jgi:multiple sugar transport system permease protein